MTNWGKIDCKELREEWLFDLKNDMGVFLSDAPPRFNKVTLAIIQVGDDDASNVYIKNKVKTCKQVGIETKVIKLKSDTNFRELRYTIEKLNDDTFINGIILQLPLPSHLKSHQQEMIDCIDWRKDVDGLTAVNKGKLWSDDYCLFPATAQGIYGLIVDLDSKYDFDHYGRNALIIGRSDLVGKPLINALLSMDFTVSIAHSHTSKEDLKKLFELNTVIISAIGKAEYFDLENMGINLENKVFIDVGINRNAEGKLCGDFKINRSDDLLESESPDCLYTNVPGGVGILTTACLAYNVFEAWLLQNGERRIRW